MDSKLLTFISKCILIIMVLNLILTSCTDSKQKKVEEIKKKEISFIFDNINLESMYKKYVKEFEKENSDIVIDIEKITDKSDFLQRIASNDFDLCNYDSFDINESYIDKFEEISNTYEFDKNRKIINDNKTIEIYCGYSTIGIIYNKRIFDVMQFGIPSTLKEFYKYAEVLKVNNFIPCGISGKDKNSISYFENQLPNLISKDINSKDSMLLTENPFSNENGFVKTYSILFDLIKNKYVNGNILEADEETLLKDFKDKKIAMLLYDTSIINSLVLEGMKFEDLGFFPFPYDNNSQKFKIFRNKNSKFAMSKGSKNVTENEKILNFIVNKKYDDYIKQAGYIDGTKNIFLGEVINVEAFFQKDSENELLFKEQLNRSKLSYEEMIEKVIKSKNFEETIKEFNSKWVK